MLFYLYPSRMIRIRHLIGDSDLAVGNSDLDSDLPVGDSTTTQYAIYMFYLFLQNLIISFWFDTFLLILRWNSITFPL